MKMFKYWVLWVMGKAASPLGYLLAPTLREIVL